MRLQIRPNGPPLLAQAWAASRSRSWAQGLGAPAPVEQAASLGSKRRPFPVFGRPSPPGAQSYRIIEPPKNAPLHCLSLRAMRLRDSIRRIEGRLGRLGRRRAAPTMGLKLGFDFFGRAFLRFAPPPLFFSPPRAPAARPPIGLAPCLPLFPHPQARRAQKAGRKRGKEEKVGKEAMLAAEGLREPRKEWRGGEAAGIRKAPNNRGLQTKAAPKHTPKGRDRPPSA